MGYNTEQFYNLVSRGVVGPNDLTPDANSNPAFMWPGSTRRHAVPFGETNTTTGRTERWAEKSGLQRGFIRMLTNTNTQDASFEIPNSLKNRRCFFQFNPQTIARNVSMNASGMMNPLLQDPSQFSVPVPGNAGFGFDLLFDRSFELNNPHLDTQAPSDRSGSADTLERRAESEDFLLNASPHKIGVLADLRVLDAIVGQGITRDMMEYMKYRGRIAASWQTSDTSVSVYTPTTTEGASGTTTSSTTTSTASADAGALPWDEAAFTAASEQNIGNQAFLIPNPVRVLFSSLFMIDGYVTGLSVTFLKFNEAMVPMQCAVNIQMQAIYIGFAKKETYLTWALDQAEERELGTVDDVEQTVDVEAKNRTVALLNTNLRRFRAIPSDAIVKANGSEWTNTDKWDNLADVQWYTNWEDNPYLESDTSRSGATERDRAFESTFPAICGKSEVKWNYGFEQPRDLDDDGIYKAFVDGAIEYLKYHFTITLKRVVGLGPFETDTEDISSYIDPNNSNLMILGSFTKATVTSTSADEWDTNRQVNGMTGEEDALLTFVGRSSGLSKAWGRAAYITIKDTAGNVIDPPTSLEQIERYWVGGGGYGSGYTGYHTKTTPYRIELSLTVEVKDSSGNVLISKVDGTSTHNENTQIFIAKTPLFIREGTGGSTTDVTPIRPVARAGQNTFT